MPIAEAEAKKSEGNTYFKNGDYKNAIKKYTEAIEIDPNNHAYWSNRSASYASLEKWENSRDDAKQCVTVNKSFVKGYFRMATAQKNLGEYEAAKETLTRGLAVDPRNADLKKNVKEIDELIRNDKVKSLIIQAQNALDTQDYSNCIKICDSILRLDAGNSKAQKMLQIANPKFEALERKRKSGLSKTEMLKEAGDDHYKKAQFEDAIKKYTDCINALKDRTHPLAIKCFSNRSACYKQLSNFDGTIEDSSAVLEVEPQNVKALMRRAQAFEAIERYRYALQDIRTVLSMPPDVVGSTNLNLANGMQHRLNRVVQQLKQAS
mmetsp:Transcript_7710/g.11608  ORF Transcript_7710/g.11608 Transcript_7710/m.11608 type:complete len:321 (+) Transcript_7710:101-1063(+)|eukprot:CAMPEP_0171457834 /NCGR_PEP_ID=MMETSP0945-20130129/3750_1 /TAXON_ID=109269 /ORGANISM="Vaucheria litorea, Strain CCMP2940" /LENGTH=320 /DNA_ID=CAMNT_0011983513 /DNA_START=97 /DNA_END=1059 /DNA_ORIENTATION=-